MTSLIGVLQESSLHAALKAWYAQPGDQLETPLGPYLIDIYREKLLIEIQTGNFTAVKQKLADLLPEYRVCLVYPVAQVKWIVRVAADGVTAVSRRKSPRRGSIYHLFDELIRLPHLLADPHFSLTVLLVEVEEVWCDDGRGSWRRRRWSIIDRRLLQVGEELTLTCPADLDALLPACLSDPFTTRQLADATGQQRRLAQKMAYCLRQLERIHIVGKESNALLYGRQPAHCQPTT
jgi:hypothetical protein